MSNINGVIVRYHSHSNYVYAPCRKLDLRGAATLLEQITDGAGIIHSNTFDRNFLHSNLKSILIKRITSFFFFFERYTASDSIMIFTN